MDAFFTVDELAARWKVSKPTVHRRIAAGDIAVLRIGGAVRIARTEIERIEASASSEPTDGVLSQHTQEEQTK